MTLMEKLTAAAEQVPLVYEAGKAICPTRHFVTTVTGDGSSALRVHIPFVPDAVYVHSFDPTAIAEIGSVLNFSADLRAISSLAAVTTSSNGSSHYSAGLRHSALASRYSQAAEGTVCICDLPCSTGITAAKFFSGASYVVTAVKHAALTDLERVTAFVQSLAGKTAALTLSKKIVTSAFPGADEENPETGESMNETWNALVKEYASGCTIALD